MNPLLLKRQILHKNDKLENFIIHQKYTLGFENILCLFNLNIIFFRKGITNSMFLLNIMMEGEFSHSVLAREKRGKYLS